MKKTPSITPRKQGDSEDDITNVDSDFDEFAEFAEYLYVVSMGGLFCFVLFFCGLLLFFIYFYYFFLFVFLLFFLFCFLFLF
jgi:hypothetical protein